MRGRSTAAAASIAAALALAAPTTASAECNEAKVNGVGGAVYCLTADPGANGTTVAPTVDVVACPWAVDPRMWVCEPPPPRTYGTTGVTPGEVPVPHAGHVPYVHASTDDATVATVHVNGTATPVTVPGVCYGPPSYC